MARRSIALALKARDSATARISSNTTGAVSLLERIRRRRASASGVAGYSSVSRLGKMHAIDAAIDQPRPSVMVATARIHHRQIGVETFTWRTAQAPRCAAPSACRDVLSTPVAMAAEILKRLRRINDTADIGVKHHQHRDREDSPESTQRARDKQRRIFAGLAWVMARLINLLREPDLWQPKEPSMNSFAKTPIRPGHRIPTAETIIKPCR